ncbi:hypothetical protein E4T49_02776 [Aureobasidium sp. EXF-10728]|nr:hypothetical protein E4T49_02776 [Aureobasidium sp. EXF-10728]
MPWKGYFKPIGDITITIPAPYAGFIRCLRLVGAVPSSVWATIGQTGLSIHDRERIEHILHESHPTMCSTNRWIRELEQGSSSAFAAFLLVYLTRLETIEIGAEFSQLFSFIGISTIQELKRLKTASIGTFRDEVYMNTGRVPLVQSDGLLYPLLFFYTPNVRQLSLNLPKPLEDVGFEWPIKDLVPLTTSLESLELTFTFLGEHDLAHILKACPKLRTLKYDLWTATEDIASPNVRVDLSTLQRALSPVKSTLEALQLHIGKYHWTSGSWNDEREDVHGYLTFHDYPRLSMLHVPIRVLTECQSWPMGDATTYHKMMVMRMRNVASVDLGAKLPKSLTCLWINLDGFDFPLGDLEGALPLFDDEELAIVVAATLDRRQTYTPLLKTLKILVSQVPYIVWEQWDSDVISNALAARDIEHGVDMSIDTVFYRCFPSVPSGVDRQLPPYFDQETIDKNRMLEKGPVGSTGGTRVLQYR